MANSGEIELSSLRESMLSALASFDMNFECDLSTKVDLNMKIEELPKFDSASVSTVDRSNSTIDVNSDEGIKRYGSLRGPSDQTKKAKSSVSLFGTQRRNSERRSVSRLKSESLGEVTPRKDSASSTHGKSPLSLSANSDVAAPVHAAASVDNEKSADVTVASSIAEIGAKSDSAAATQPAHASPERVKVESASESAHGATATTPVKKVSTAKPPIHPETLAKHSAEKPAVTSVTAVGDVAHTKAAATAATASPAHADVVITLTSASVTTLAEGIEAAIVPATTSVDEKEVQTAGVATTGHSMEAHTSAAESTSASTQSADTVAAVHVEAVSSTPQRRESVQSQKATSTPKAPTEIPVAAAVAPADPSTTATATASTTATATATTTAGSASRRDSSETGHRKKDEPKKSGCGCTVL
eukprot:Opistho-2@67929